MNGKDKTFYNFEPIILKNLDKIPDRDFTHLAYAYGVRNVGNPELHKAFEARINKIALTLDYPSLFNIMYYMLFRDSGNKQIWGKLIKATLNNKEILPIVYYRPFKAAYVYLKGRFPDMEKDEEFIDFQDKFWYAERYFQTIKLEEYFDTDHSYS